MFAPMSASPWFKSSMIPLNSTAFCADPADFICAQVDIGTKIVMSKIIDLLRLLLRLDAVSIILFDRIEYMIPPLIVD